MKISVCIPVYNVEAYIERCIKSVLNQSYQDFEIIVINDASSDKSMEIVKRLAKEDKRIMIYSNDNNMGLMWTRKEGYMRAKGDYITFLDSDDTLPPNALSYLYTAIDTSGADIVCGSMASITSKGVELTRHPNKLLYGNNTESAIKSVLHGDITHNMCGKIYRRELLQTYNYKTYKDVTHAEDFILFYQVLCNIKKIYIVTETVYNYYLYYSSSSNSVYGDNALRGLFLGEKQRYDIIYNKYPNLLTELYVNMTVNLALLAPSINNPKQINEYLWGYNIPYKINLYKILKFVPYNKLIKCLLSYYCSSLIKKIRFYRLRKLSK